MSGSIQDPFISSPPTDKDKNVLDLVFGNKTCIDNPILKFLQYFGLAIIATIVFWLLSTVMIKQYFGSNVMEIQIMLFFIIILILDWAFTSWRQNQPVCP